MNPKQVIERLQNDKMLDVMFQPIGIKPDYTYESVDKLEQKLNRLFPDEKEERAVPMIILVGFYLGETLRHTITDAKWETNCENIFDVYISFDIKEGSSRAYPFIRASRFFQDRTDGLSVYIRTLLSMQMNFLDKESLPPGEWHLMPNGDQIRMTQVKKDE